MPAGVYLLIMLNVERVLAPTFSGNANVLCHVYVNNGLFHMFRYKRWIWKLDVDNKKIK